MNCYRFLELVFNALLLFLEHDLNMEIDRLVRVTGEQKRRIAELDCQVTEEKIKTSSFEMQKPLEMVSTDNDY